MIRTVILASVLLVSAGSASSVPQGRASAANSCVITPIRPIPPVGCKDLVARCVCDENGDNCRWEWTCVR
jgi:hypothetical protein